MKRKYRKLEFLSRKGTFATITLYFQSASLLIPIVSLFAFNLTPQTLLLSILITIWIDVVVSFKSRQLFGIKLSRKALTKIGIYALILSFLIFYQIYFFGSNRIVLASSCPATRYCPGNSGCSAPGGGSCPSSYIRTDIGLGRCFYDLDTGCCYDSYTEPISCGSQGGGPGYIYCGYASESPDCKCTGCSGGCVVSDVCYYSDSCTSTGESYSSHACVCPGCGSSCVVGDTCKYQENCGSSTYTAPLDDPCVCPSCTGPCASGTTCYYNDMCSLGETYSSCSLACSGVGTTCCPSQGTYRSGITCDATDPYCHYTDYDRDSASSYCTSTASGCTAYSWFTNAPTSGTRCCGDDGAENSYYYSASPTTATSLTCERCNAGSYVSPATYYGNGYCPACTSATQPTCYYGDITCTAASGANGATTSSCYGNGYYSGSLTTSTSITCYSGDVTCTADVGCSNGASNACYGNGYYTGTPSTSTTGTCYPNDITGCTDGVACSSSSTVTLYGNGYLSGSGTSRTCYWGDWSCSDGSSQYGYSSTVYGWGYWTGTTCYYGGGSCGDGSYGDGAYGSTYCSAGTSTCCPTQGTRAEGVSCNDGSIGGTSWDRDTSQARCEDGSSYNCQAKSWFSTYTAGNNPNCCGDDGTSDVFENSGPGNSACTSGESVTHNNRDSSQRYVAYNGELFYCKAVGGSGSGYNFVQDVNPGSSVGSWKCDANGYWAGGEVIGIRGGRIKIV